MFEVGMFDVGPQSLWNRRFGGVFMLFHDFLIVKGLFSYDLVRSHPFAFSSKWNHIKEMSAISDLHQGENSSNMFQMLYEDLIHYMLGNREILPSTY